MAHEAGKGSQPRPFSVSQDEWARRWDAIFGRDLDNDQEPEREERHTRNNEETQLVKENKF